MFAWKLRKYKSFSLIRVFNSAHSGRDAKRRVIISEEVMDDSVDAAEVGMGDDDDQSLQKIVWQCFGFCSADS